METLLIGICVAGILNTIYLSYHAIRGTNVACLVFPDAWCDKVQHSKQSKTMGIPNPYLGLGMLLVILVLNILAFQGQLPFWIPFALMTFGAAFATYFMAVQAFVIKAFCTWCVLNWIVFLALFAVGLVLL